MILKVGNVLVPDIIVKIEKKLKELNLKAEIPPKEFLKIHKTDKHRYFSPCLTKKGEKIGFYARWQNNLDSKKKLIKEIEFLKLIRESRFEIKEIIPNIIDSGIEKDFEWFFREYPPAPPLGHSRRLFQKPEPKIAEKIAKAILNIPKIHFKSLKLKKFDYKNYFIPGLCKDLTERKIISKKTSKELSNFVKKNLSLLEKENKYFSHGDLNLGNILSAKNEIWIIDWELIHFNNFAYDIGYLWAHLWQAERHFRNRLIKDYIVNLKKEDFEKFKILFPIVVSYLSLGGIELKRKNEKNRFFEKRRNFYLELLKNCLNFDKLIKI